MKYRYWIISLLILTCMLSASAVERQLAGIRLGMTPGDVVKKLGDPTAIIMAQPPLAGGNSSTGSTTSTSENTLIYLYQGSEIELKPDTTVVIGKAPIGSNAIHDWAYTVRVAKLSLNQQEFIYRINDTYSLGITVTGERTEARVTDVIACSLMPLTFWPSDPNRGYSKSDPFFKDMFTFTYGDKHSIFAGTSKKVTIGSRLDEVLKQHKWPEYFIPFNTQPTAMMIFQPDQVRPQVKTAQGTLGTGGSAEFAFGPSSTEKADFANNYILIYPEDELALTLMNNLVVRIQIGKEITRPNMKDFVPKNVGGDTPATSGMNP